MSPFVLLQHLLPKLLLTRWAGLLAQARAGRLSQAQIRWFIRRYGVDMSEATQADPEAYACFNDFFTRALRPDARPLAEADFVCPVDGAVSQLGHIEGDQIFQAKGHRYSIQALLGGDAAQAAAFQDGEFATIYLSPRDYHRIHMPCAGGLRRMTHVPGDLFSVNPETAAGVPGLFARNERVVCLFEMADGRPMALVLVGATIVGSMATTWHGVVNPPRPGVVRHWDYAPGQQDLAQGAEMGRFLLGSTVVLLWPRDAVRLATDWQAGSPVRMGQAMGLRPTH
ncbi:MAG: archaetidylserine decarboxylase [Alphaproteobacteria bacterium]|nr:archaetidylserine decarboxylase [Alphaproteobacteria bacterium]